jgi:flagellar motility protein MotE (MotC chaperone)
MRSIKAIPIGLGLLALALGVQGVSLIRAYDAQAADTKPTPAAKAAATKSAPAKSAPTQSTPGKATPANSSAPSASATNDAPQSRTEMTLQNDVAERRAAVTARAQQLELKEQLLKASEKRLAAKMAQVKAAEAKTKKEDTVQTAKSSEEFNALVKVYETMKPKDAARIFERLDLNVQLAVGSRMKPAKMAAMMAQMNPDAAKTLTMRLAQRAKIAESVDSET